MENKLEMVFDETTLWVPRVGGAIAIILVSYVLSKIIKSAITKGCEQVKL